MDAPLTPLENHCAAYCCPWTATTARSWPARNHSACSQGFWSWDIETLGRKLPISFKCSKKNYRTKSWDSFSGKNSHHCTRMFCIVRQHDQAYGIGKVSVTLLAMAEDDKPFQRPQNCAAWFPWAGALWFSFQWNQGCRVSSSCIKHHRTQTWGRTIAKEQFLLPELWMNLSDILSVHRLSCLCMWIVYFLTTSGLKLEPFSASENANNLLCMMPLHTKLITKTR